jgi:hypothetical protein
MARRKKDSPEGEPGADAETDEEAQTTDPSPAPRAAPKSPEPSDGHLREHEQLHDNPHR